MKNIGYLLLCIICLVACETPANEAELKGEIKGLKSDTIVLYANDELSTQVHTLVLSAGKLNHKIPTDTLVHLMMVIDGTREYPLYLDKNKTVTIRGDLSQSPLLDVRGVEANDKLTAFFKTVQAPELSTDSIQTLAEKFIHNNQLSPASIYVLDHYFVQQPQPDASRITRLIDLMDGVLQDKPYIEKLKATAEQAEKGMTGKPAISFTIPNAEGEKISRSNYRGKHLLITFWASWSDSCRTANAELREVYKQHGEHSKFAMLGISLDLDRTQWKAAIAADTLQWEQLCDFTGWTGELVKDYAITAIPYNILLGTDGRITDRNLTGNALTEKLERLLPPEEKPDKKKKKK